MFVVRNLINVKMGCMEELVQLCKKITWFSDRNIPWRIYAAEFGPQNVLAMEADFESFAAYEKIGKEWDSSPEAKAFWNKYIELAERGGTSECWRLM